LFAKTPVRFGINNIAAAVFTSVLLSVSPMFRFLKLCFGTLVRLFRSRYSLLLENLALGQQLVVLKRRHPHPKLDLFDKLFWLVVRRGWSGWEQASLDSGVDRKT